MAERPFTQADLDVLAQWDTPTICNGLEITNPERRRFGYTVEPMVCLYPKAKPIVGLARVGMIRSTEPPRGKVTDRADWYDYVHATDFPTIAVIQDIDGAMGYGAYWGEVQSTIHKALGLDRLRHQRVVPRPGYVGGGLSDDRRPRRAEPCACPHGHVRPAGEHLRHAGGP